MRAITREFAPGFRVSSGAHLLHLFDGDIRKDLELDRHGLSEARSDLKTVALAADGQHLVIAGDSVSGGDISEQDKARLKEYRRFMSRFARVIGKMHNQVPPRIASGQRSDLFALTRLALKIRLLGKSDMREFLRIAGINIYDVLQESFDNELLKGALSLDGVLGNHLGPRSNNSVFSTLHRMSGNNTGGFALPKGGMGAVSDALAAAAQKLGVEIRTGCVVRQINMAGDRVSGVTLEGGEALSAATVISNADPKTTFLDLLGTRHIEAGFAQKIHHIRARGNAAKLHLALSDLPDFKGVAADQLGERLVIAPDMDYVERAFNHAKYGEYSPAPVAEITIPSIHDPALAPAGQHVLSAVVQYAPLELKQGWGEAKAAFTNKVMDLLGRYAPDIRQKTLKAEVLTPQDIENEFRMTGGHWHHGEMTLDHFLMLRPVPGAAQYATPVNGLFLCGAGAHPGGGVMGSAGRNAATVVLNHPAASNGPNNGGGK